MLISMFASVQKHIGDELDMHDFVKLMHLNGGGIFRDNGEGGADNAGLMMMSYRRQVILSEIRDPSKRRAFSSKESFESKYGSQKKKRGTSFSVSSEDDGAAHAATYSDLSTAQLLTRSLSHKSMEAQEEAQPRAKWLAATAVEINEGRKFVHAQLQKQHESATSERERPSMPELIEALEVRKDAVTGGVRVVGNDRDIGLMDAMEANMSKEGVSLSSQEGDSSHAQPVSAAAPSWGEAEAPADDTKVTSSYATSVPKLPPLAN